MTAEMLVKEAEMEKLKLNRTLAKSSKKQIDSWKVKVAKCWQETEC